MHSEVTPYIEKAFDKVEWNVLMKVLQFFGYGEGIIKMISTLCKDAQSCVMNNGEMSEWFDISRSVRQGCPLSSTLFVFFN